MDDQFELDLPVTLHERSLIDVLVRGLQKNTAHLLTLFALSNLWMARRQLMALQGAVRPRAA